ncbi:MAG: alpha/beta hydrolase [Actinomycetota bacterium]|nr:alpha/beta hydrolase [Actinomycetota bacterium]
MTTFGLVHGAFHGAWCWDLLTPALHRLDHNVIPIDLPCDDPTADVSGYAQIVIDALSSEGEDVVLVGHSLGGLTIPLVAAARPVRRMVFLNAFIPQPGVAFSVQASTETGMFPSTPEATWPVTDDDGLLSWPADRAIPALYPDCPDDVATWAASNLRRQSLAPHQEPCPLQAWPQVPSSYILCTDDSALSPQWARRAANDRLGQPAHELPGGHSPFLSRPYQLAELLHNIAHQ